MMKIISCNALKSASSRRIAHSFSVLQLPRDFSNTTKTPFLNLERGVQSQTAILVSAHLMLDRRIDEQYDS